MQNEFYELREDPFRLLQLLEQRCRSVTHGSGATSNRREWVGIAFRVGNEVFLTSRGDVREVINMLPVTRVPGAKNWMRGLANLRSHLLPIVDLGKFIGGREHKQSLQERLLVVNHPKVPVGLIVDEVIGFRRFNENELSKDSKMSKDFTELSEYVLGSCKRDNTEWSVIGLKKLVESSSFLSAGAG